MTVLPIANLQNVQIYIARSVSIRGANWQSAIGNPQFR
jgi:hypothetical protein